jgi:hypothetical protein
MEQDFLKLGVQAARAGDYKTAQTYFIRVVQANPNSEKGWLYLGRCMTDPEKRITCYQRVLRINPSNQDAQKALSTLSQPNLPREINQNPYDRQPAPDQPADQARQTPPVKNRALNTCTVILGSVAGVVVCLGLVCFAISKMPSPAQTVPTQVPITPTASLPEFDAAILPASVAPTGVGKVCVGFGVHGVACLDERGWQTYNSDTAGFSSDYVTAGAICPDGRLVIANNHDFARGYDQQWEQIPSLGEGFGDMGRLACDKDNRIWVAHQKGVSRYIDGAWQTYGLEFLVRGKMNNEYVSTVIAAPDGRIWALTTKSVAMFADDKWTVFQDGQGLLGIPSALTLDATGRPWAWVNNGVAVYENGSWKQFKTTAPVSPNLISLDARGWYWLGASYQGLAVFDGKAWSSYNRETQNLLSNTITALAVDSLGRVWVGTEYGLSVFDGSGWQTYRMDNADLLDNQVTFVAVERDGPTLPPLVDKAKGSLTGTLPVIGKHVELCSEFVSSASGNTPCAGQPFSMSTQSNDQGVFVFENVPAGYYYLLAETDNGWVKLVDQSGSYSETVLITPGELYDLGVLEFVTK